ncbi:hypothetical protein PCASD_23033 [Puccinia coronata f. sp. avenae]|uniref:Uncharacterized protein n=1 Tax=Puccinia coronata f. sp. avenae TaxID=200324 RepID=A0A2N5TNE0_9BASI|nr:hypothetical protein PCASD_23033 [Puccinia coronata f. sp. avenae]
MRSSSPTLIAVECSLPGDTSSVELMGQPRQMSRPFLLNFIEKIGLSNTDLQRMQQSGLSPAPVVFSNGFHL